jgi:hypothetical protein
VLDSFTEGGYLLTMTPVAEMTNAQIVEAVIVHLEAQGKQALGAEGDQCVYYREVDQARCAIGGILPLEMAQWIGDWRGDVYDLATEFSEVGRWLGIKDLSPDSPFVRFLTDVQSIHDDRDSWDNHEGFKAQEKLRSLLDD